MKKLILFTAALGLTVGVAIGQNLPAYVPSDGLVGWWPFNGNANDESGNGNDGTVNGATLTEDRFGNAESAYSFDGVDDFISCGDIDLIDGATELTISLWMNPQQIMDYMRILGKESSFDSNQGFNIKCSGPDDPNNASGNIISNIRTNSVLPGVFTSYVPPINTWTHVVLLFDGTASDNANRAQFFLNGTNVLTTYSAIIPANISNTSYPLWIGGINPNSAEFPFNGKIDDIGIWNRALTPEEIQQLYSTDACTFTVYDTTEVAVYDTLYETVINYETIYDTLITVDTLFETVTNYETVYDTLTAYETIYDTLIIVDTLFETVTNYETVYDTVTTYQSISVTDTLVIDITLGIAPNSTVNTLLLYPNPTSDILYIHYGNFTTMAGYTLTIFNGIGASVHSTLITQAQESLDLTSWSAGNYQVVIYSPEGVPVDTRTLILE